MDERTPGGAADPKRTDARDPQSLLQQQEAGRAEEAHLDEEIVTAMGEATARIRGLENERQVLMAGAVSGTQAREERVSRKRAALEHLRRALQGSAASLLAYAAVFAGAAAVGGAAGLFT